MDNLRLATFRFDVTPPLGHSLCGGWIQPACEVGDPLEAIGLVLLGAGDPVVLCTLDWTGLLNSTHLQWRQQLGEAAGTSADRVAIHCVHQHDAPMVCLETQKLVAAQGNMPHVVLEEYLDRCLEDGRRAIQQAVSAARSVTHIAGGQAQVERIAANRRIARDDRGRVTAERRSFCTDQEICDLPEGLIDPWLKTVGFYNGDQPLAKCHYYATHPQSFYGEGRVSSDFVGLARKRRQQEEPGCHHIYFTGCAGNVSAGKYNDGTPRARQEMIDRLHDGIIRAEQSLKPEPIESVLWRSTGIPPRARDTLFRPALVDQLGNSYYHGGVRGRAAFMLTWLDRSERGDPLPLSSLQINDIILLGLPGECFIEYQLRAQQAAPEKFVATAAYGDCGPWYIPLEEEFDKGGYELTSTFSSSETEQLLNSAIKELLP